VVSILASTWPAFTTSPGFTSTSVTVPEAVNPRSSWDGRVTLPEAETWAVTSPRWTATVRPLVDLVESEEPSSAQAPAPPAATTTASEVFIQTPLGSRGLSVMAPEVVAPN
jgi:hypothetical protein